MKNQTYTQVKLTKQIENGVGGVIGILTDVAWIPSEFAVIGKKVKIKYDTGWDSGWVVSGVYHTMDRILVVQNETLYKRTRKHSDVPKGTFKRS